MTILASLVRAYDRMAARGKMPAFGYSQQNIGFLISLEPDGSPAGEPTDLREGEGRKRSARVMAVPQPSKRTSGIAPNFLWDKTAYVLGVTVLEGKRTAQEHQAFVEEHRKWLAGTDDKGLSALLRFLDFWKPEKFAELGWPEEMKDQNVAFGLESERLANIRIHDRQAARDLWARLSAEGEKAEAVCLVTGERGPVARLHPPIKGVWGAQPSGASIVSFNHNAFTSYGHEQGDNAPVSEAAAFAYTSALNRFLKSDSGHLIQIGDATTVFWADASEAETAELAENVFVGMFGVDEEEESKKVGQILARLRQGFPLKTIAPELAKGVRFYVVGLAPNDSRLSIRFWYENDFSALAEAYQLYVSDIRFEPEPKKGANVTIPRLVLRTAPARREKNGSLKFDSKRVPSALSGELLRSILTADRFPLAILGNVIMRVRSDGIVEWMRVALIKAIIARTMRIEQRLPRDAQGRPKEDYLVHPDPDDNNPARRMGQLFALIERAQLAALGDQINATVKDKYLGAAAATPQQVLAKLVMNAEEHHLKRLRNGHSDANWIKDSQHARRVGAALNRRIGTLWATFGGEVPAQHSAEEQGLFLVGYYQERYGRSMGGDDARPDEDVLSDNEEVME